MTTLTPVPSSHGTPPKPTPTERRAMTIGAVVLAVIVAVAGAVTWWFLAQPAAVDLAAAEAVTTQIFVDLDGAETTVDVRAVAATAASEADQLRAALAADGIDQDTRTAATAQLRVWEQVAALQSLTGDSLDQWSATQPGLALALTDLTGYVPATLTEQGKVVLASIDELVAQAQVTMAAWTAQRDAAAATQQQNMSLAAAADSYRGTVSAQLTLYESLRLQTTAQVKALYDPAIEEETWPLVNQLRAGETDRQSILAALGATAVPSGLEAEHNRILTVIQDSIVAMRAAQRAVDEAQTARYMQYDGVGDLPPFLITAAPSWQAFATGSAKIDKEFPAAWTAMSDQVDALVAQYQQPVAVPPKPTV